MTPPPAADPPPLIAHVIDRLAVGGMENGIVNLINRMPVERYRHAIICLRGYTAFRERIRRPDVQVLDLAKRPGLGLDVYARLWRTLRRLRPAIVHTRNLPTIDLMPAVALAGVPARVHGEHGRDVLETHGQNRKYNRLRRAVAPWVHRYVAVSKDIAGWLADDVGVPGRKVTQIYNGVDSERFHPPAGDRDPVPSSDIGDDTLVIGTVGRMETIKDQPNLARAFLRLRERVPPQVAARLRLAMIGDGTLREPVRALLSEGGAEAAAWLPGMREDVPDLLRAFDAFVLPSINEGISNTILEAMACGRPVIATAVGGNPELVVDGETGRLVPPQDADALAAALAGYVTDPGLMRADGQRARQRIESHFSMEAMVDGYLSVYDSLVTRR